MAKYPSALAALERLIVKTAYLDGELCRVDADGLPSFAQTQAGPTGSGYRRKAVRHLVASPCSMKPIGAPVKARATRIGRQISTNCDRACCSATATAKRESRGWAMPSGFRVRSGARLTGPHIE
jgi:hypothetical protein